MKDIIIKKIKEVVLNSDYEKGKDYPKNYILPLNCITFTNEAKLFKFKVQSQNTRNIYKCEVLEKDGKIIKTNCTCPKFEGDESCKHIASILIGYANDIFELTKEEKKLTISKKILKEFSNIKRNQNKEQITLEFILEEVFYNSSLLVRLRIGTTKQYIISNLFEFIYAYQNEDELYIGKNFTYNPNTHYFNNKDKKILDFLLNICDYAPYKVKGAYVSLTTYEKDEFLSLLKDCSFEIKNHGKFNGILEENPIDTELIYNKNNYTLTLKEMDKITFLDEKHRYIIKDNKLYHIPLKLSKFLNKMLHYNINTLTFVLLLTYIHNIELYLQELSLPYLPHLVHLVQQIFPKRNYVQILLHYLQLYPLP